MKLLKELGVHGLEHELARAVNDVAGHALSLNLLGTYLDTVEGGDILKRDHLQLHEIVDTTAELALEDQTGRLAKRAQRILTAYVVRLQEIQQNSRAYGAAATAIMHLVGLFDRPAPGHALHMLLQSPSLPTLNDFCIGLAPEAQRRLWHYTIKRLQVLRLLNGSSDGNLDDLDAHPLVRQYFGHRLKQERPDVYVQAHQRLYNYYMSMPAKDFPDTIEEMSPLILAAAHGCAADRHQEVFDKIYTRRLRRGGLNYLCSRLGGFSADLTVLAQMFDHPWTTPSKNLSKEAAAGILGFAGSRLRALGRFRESEQPMIAAVRFHSASKNWREAAINSSNVSEVRLVLGDIDASIEYAKESVQYADKSGDGWQQMSNRTSLGDALHQAGLISDARAAFEDGERILMRTEPQYRMLITLRGARYCELLLDLHYFQEVLHRATYSLGVDKLNKWPVNIALDHLCIGRASLALEDWKNAAENLDRAVTGLRSAGIAEYLPKALLARAALRREAFERFGRDADMEGATQDLMEVDEIARRWEMALVLVDCLLEGARLEITQSGYQKAKDHLAEATKLVNTTKYQRRNLELATLRNRLEGSGTSQGSG